MTQDKMNGGNGMLRSQNMRTRDAAFSVIEVTDRRRVKATTRDRESRRFLDLIEKPDPDEGERDFLVGFMRKIGKRRLQALLARPSPNETHGLTVPWQSTRVRTVGRLNTEPFVELDEEALLDLTEVVEES
jgi:hypothetical protein